MQTVPERPETLYRTLSDEFGLGASAYSVEELNAWRTAGQRASSAMQARDWEQADRLAAVFVNLRPDWPRGYELRRCAMTRLGRPSAEVSEMLRQGIERCAGSRNSDRLEDALAHLQSERLQHADDVITEDDAGAKSVKLERPKFKSKVKGLKLLAHELGLVESGQLVDITHSGSSAIWLSTESALLEDDSKALVYRPMGDMECHHLLTSGTLPDTQPYQTIVEGKEGRIYAEKYLRGHKSVDSSPTTVVEFAAPRGLVQHLFAMQSKNEDGAISHGLGDKGGRGLPLFNASLQSGETTFRIVLVKRFAKRATGAFGAGRRRC
eukprot:TRINITY_DN5950_c0_g1_i1.p1 TRINITY_DN5950_c0_g1~~TRINITY_DN5950_c0_g1_i1.p1  ORF type:complete len:332 (+),score=43.70 TRINITY_DN5950_c0_g1_i1:28-996(+)